MARIDITRRHDLDPERTRAVIRHIADSLEHKFGVTPRWDGDVLRFDRSGVNGFITASNGLVRISANLGLLLTPFKATVEAEIMRKLDQYFPAAK